MKLFFPSYPRGIFSYLYTGQDKLLQFWFSKVIYVISLNFIFPLILKKKSGTLPYICKLQAGGDLEVMKTRLSFDIMGVKTVSRYPIRLGVYLFFREFIRHHF